MIQLKIFFITCLLLMIMITARAEESGSANYAYSVFTGTGKYRIKDRTIYSIRIPLEFTAKEPDYDSDNIGYKLLLPIAVGITDFDEIDNFPELRIDSMQTMSVAPGFEIQIPIISNWQIKPFCQAGLGWDMNSSNVSYIWGAGARTRTWFGDNRKWLFGGEFLWAGNDPKHEDEPNTTFTRLSLGTEYKLQTNWSPFGHRISWHGRLIQYYYTHEVTFQAPPEKVTINNTTEVGLSVGINPPIHILGYAFRQGGVAYLRSENVRAIELFTTFPF